MTRCYFVPPHILSHLATHGETPEVRARAHAQALLDQALRAGRDALLPVPVEGQGEEREIQDAGGQEVDRGPVRRKEDAPPGADASVNGLYDGLGNVWAYLAQARGYRSYDGRGARMVAVAHFGTRYDNAFWNGRVYCSGDGDVFNPMWTDLTVEGHEMHHAVDQHARGVGPYQGQAGALMEHFADFGGICVQMKTYDQAVSSEDARWLIGAKICEGRIRTGIPGVPAALRNMLHQHAYDDPRIGKDPQPSDMAHYVTTSQDNGGVHINNGIPNRAFALAAIQIGGRAWERAGAIWWDAYTARINPDNPTFQAFAATTLAAAEALFGTGSLEAQAVVGGWKAVGIDAAGVPAPEPKPKPRKKCPPFSAEVLEHVEALLQHAEVRALVARLSGRRGLGGTGGV